MTNARVELDRMKLEYEQKKKTLTTEGRAKERNKISALESRIKRKLSEESLKEELSVIKAKMHLLTEILDEKLDSGTIQHVIDELKMRDPFKRKRSLPKLGPALNEYFGFTD